MFCPSCGKEIDDDAQFCGYCGKSFASRDAAAQAAGTAGAAATSATASGAGAASAAAVATKKRKSPVALIVIAVVVIVALVLIVPRCSGESGYATAQEAADAFAQADAELFASVDDEKGAKDYFSRCIVMLPPGVADAMAMNYGAKANGLADALFAQSSFEQALRNAHYLFKGSASPQTTYAANQVSALRQQLLDDYSVSLSVQSAMDFDITVVGTAQDDTLYKDEHISKGQSITWEDAEYTFLEVDGRWYLDPSAIDGLTFNTF